MRLVRGRGRGRRRLRLRARVRARAWFRARDRVRANPNPNPSQAAVRASVCEVVEGGAEGSGKGFKSRLELMVCVAATHLRG